MLVKVRSFLKRPAYTDTAYSRREKVIGLIKLTAAAISCSVALGIIVEIIVALLGLDFDDHAVMDMFQERSPFMILVMGVVLAPVIEELIFRAPLGLFKHSRYFAIAFYISVVLFGILHITNFEDIGNNFWLAPVLVAPQLSAGIFLGYIRTEFGLAWSIMLHAAHNLIILAPFIVIKTMQPPF